LGTTTLKVVAFDEAGQELAQATRGVELRHDDTGAAEQEPFAVYAAVTDALAQVASAVRAHGHSIVRVGISAAMHSLIPVAADGTPLARAMLWMDSRPQAEAQALWATPAGKAIYARTGTPIHAMTPLVKLLWMRRNRPDLLARASRFVSLKEWVWHRWFGEWVVDASIASATGLYNLREGTWDAEALQLVGFGADKLSPLVATTYNRQGVREAELLTAGITGQTAFTVGASDGVLANLGVGALTPDQMVLTIGTSCAVRSGSPQPFTDPATRSFCYVLAPDRFIVGGPSSSGGIVLDWLFHKVLGDGTGRLTPDAFAALIAAAEYADPGALLCLPYVAGERAPIWDARASAVLVGLRLEHTRAHIMRAAIEGILFNAYWIAAPLIQQFGPPRRLVASGGVLETEWIRQLTADIFGIPVHFRGPADASALGAALLARIAAGDLTWEQVARHGSAEEGGAVTQPRSLAGYRTPYERFRQLAEALTTQLAGLYLGE
jgi:gluconokinase